MDIERLEQEVLDLHGCHGTHLQTIPVREAIDGLVVWEGNVESFWISDHPKAKLAYAWSYQADAGKTQYVAVLAVPPVATPIDAVRAYIAAHIQKQK
jgi:hypothetical protein